MLSTETMKFSLLSRPFWLNSTGKFIFTAVMTSSTTSNEGRHWPSVVLGKIRSLWNAGASTASAGLNQLISGTKLQHNCISYSTHCFCFSFFFIFVYLFLFSFWCDFCQHVDLLCVFF